MESDKERENYQTLMSNVSVLMLTPTETPRAFISVMILMLFSCHWTTVTLANKQA